jgi:hypothetical protein
MRDLLPPREVIAAQPVREHDRRPASEHLVMNLGAVATQFHSDHFIS